MKYLEKYELKVNDNIIPILSLNKFSHLIGIPLKKLRQLADKADLYYSPFTKNIGGKSRKIDNPIGFLKNVQSRIHNRILKHIIFPNFVVGGIKGQNPLMHPRSHIKKPIVITIDVEDCYYSITNGHVFEVWHKYLGCSGSVSRLATKLSTTRGSLPLGAPTSTYLANLALLPSVYNASQIAKNYNFTLTQHVDDIAFSGYAMPTNFMKAIIKEFSRKNFKIKREKIYVMYSNSPQYVTKKLVNRKVSVSTKKRSNIRAALHELSLTNPNGSGYSKKYYSVHGRINDLKNSNITLAEKMMKRFAKIEKPN